MEQRTCKHCGESKPLTSFNKDRSRVHKTGKVYIDKTYTCHVCVNIKYGHANKAWRGRNKLHMKKLYMLTDARKRAIKKGIEFRLSIEDINIPTMCPLREVPLDIETSKSGGSDDAPSIDRIDSTKGYTPDNVWVISRKANTIKNDATWQEILQIANNLRMYKA